MTRTYLSEAIKKRIAGKQNFKCANKPGSNLKGLEGYSCDLWKLSDGTFGEALYEIDHIEEYCISQNHAESNLQALCPSCHRVKTNRFRVKQIGLSDDPNRNFIDSKPNNKVLNQNEIKNNRIIRKLYTCDRCKTIFDRKQTYDGHIKRKYKCEEICDLDKQKLEVAKKPQVPVEIATTDIIVPKTKKQHICNNCGTEFTRSTTLTRHKNGRCKGSAVVPIPEDKVIEISRRIGQLEDRISQLKLGGTNPKNIVLGDIVMGDKNTTNNNTINNVNIIAFYSDDMESVMISKRT
jgi:hypothetical protein